MNERKPRLNARLWRAFILQIVLISATAVAGVFLAEFAIRELLIVSALEREAGYFWSRYNITRDTPAPNTNTFIGYVFGRGAPDTPEEFQDLGLGIHDLTMQVGKGVVHVSESQDMRLYLIFDANNVDKLATYFGIMPLALMLIVLYCSAWVAYGIARRAVSPVVRLARAVRDIDVETADLEAFEAANQGQGHDVEIYSLSNALRHLMARVDRFVERERTFTRETSHELRSPLTVIRMASDALLNRETLGDGARSLIAKIKRSAQDMEELTEALLALARDFEGTGRRESVSINEVIEDELGRCRIIYHDAPVTLDLDETVRLVVDSPPKIAGIVFGNLIRNACAYTDKGTVIVTVHAAGVTIHDSGIGMSKEHLGRLFTPYFRASNSRGSGHGVGLSMVKRLTDRLGWSVDIQSEPNRGTLVEVTIPDAHVDPLETSGSRVATGG
ncbi:MAG: HAMP domain-containing sensor histidine kinase [Pseudomonadota bacterium]|nr:HAMP domain-containing sensor histidine kinase [Pseudomonadota bacterium]